MNDADFRTNTVFYLYPTNMNDPAVTLAERNRHLAYGIPALTPAAGLRGLGRTLGNADNFNLNNHDQIARPNGWPNNRGFDSQWCHSDMKDVPYYFTFSFYLKLLQKGNLQ